MKIKNMPLPGVILIEPTIYNDNRGHFLESHSHKKYVEAGIKPPFVQDNLSVSKKNVIRGLHYQLEHAQDKLVYVISGTILDVVVDIRKGSPTFGKWMSQILSDENYLQLFIPKGFAHGISTLSENAKYIYKCTDYYNPQSEFGIQWNDPDLNIDWQISQPILSEKDSKHMQLNQIPSQFLPTF
ncbi:MAG: dTDP-4-dehydrorhamnose 3,5-epimerase [Gammaproteobacteria bacterium]